MNSMWTNCRISRSYYSLSLYKARAKTSLIVLQVSKTKYNIAMINNLICFKRLRKKAIVRSNILFNNATIAK